MYMLYMLTILFFYGKPLVVVVESTLNAIYTIYQKCMKFFFKNCIQEYFYVNK